jgi:hypothetical protein
MTAQETLDKFYRTYCMWIVAGAPVDNEYAFHRGVGLCSNIFGEDVFIADRAREIMTSQFLLSGLDKDYPFGGEDIYHAESEMDAHYLNYERIAWVRKQVEAAQLS